MWLFFFNCVLAVMWLSVFFLVVPWVGLQYVNVTFPGHSVTHFLFLILTHCLERFINKTAVSHELFITTPIFATTCDFQRCAILTSVDSKEPV